MTVQQTRLTNYTQVITNPTVRIFAKILFGFVLVSLLFVTFYESLLILDYYMDTPFESAFAELNISANAFAIYMILWRIIRMLAFIGVASLIFSKRSDTRIGIAASLWLLAMGVTNSDLTSLNTYLLTETSGVVAGNQGVTGAYLGAFGSIWLTWVGWTFIMTILLIYPNGRVEPRWSWIIAVAWIVLSSLWSIIPLESRFHPLMWNFYLRIAISAGLWIALVLTLILRYRKYFSPIERQQAKWVFYSVFMYAFIYFVYNIMTQVLQLTTPYTARQVLADGMGIVVETGIVGSLVCIAIALLRYRLWDIDLVINRSLVYGTIVAIIGAIFFISLLGLQLLGSTQPLLATGISLGVTALLYQRAKRAIQDFVDHKIYGFRVGLNEVNHLKSISKPSVETIGQLTGMRFGNYELLDLLGKGGMGAVYKVYEANEALAIKVLHVDISGDGDMRRRFEREAKAGMKLQHPNIVKVREIGEQDDYQYMVMDYIEGQDLRKRLKQEGMIDLDSAITIISQLCEGLNVAHEEQYVHRDIKPANVMLRKNGSPVLMDFGIAKLRDNRTVITKTGAIGTIDYMAPEQIMEAKEVDARADIYALGVVLYEMLSGHPPFKGSPTQLLFAHIQQPAPDIQDELPTIPFYIASAIMRAMEKDPDDRQQTAFSFAESLRN